MSDEPSTEQRIREAAFRALAEHGYADLSIKDIGAELGQNPSIIYHYFDSKDQLLLAMLDDFVEVFVSERERQSVTDARAELERLVSQVLEPSPDQLEGVMHDPPSDIETAVSRVYVELWAHATWDDDFRREMTLMEDRLRAVIVRLVRTGIENEQFRPVDVELTADHVLFLLEHGIHARATTDRDDAVERVRRIVDGIIADISREDVAIPK